MDFDEENKPKEVSKPRRFAPGRAGKSKPKPIPKPEPIAQKPEPIAQKPEPSPSPTESVSKSEHDVDAKFANPNVEHEVYNGPVKMEIDSKVDKEPETMEAEMIEEDQVLPLQEEKDDEEEEEEEDVVVREINVFFNPSIDANTKLYVLQYPLRPSWRPYEMDERCEEVRVNPSTSQVEIDLAMDVHSKNYDSVLGSTLKMTKQTLTTTWKQPPTLDYAIGILSGDKLYLNPVHAVAQLRPSMQYLSSTGKKKQAESTDESVGTSKKQNKGVQTSTDQKPINEESWVALSYHGLQSEYCSRYLNGMMANGNSSLDFNMSPDVYINELCRGGSNRNSESKERSKRVLFSLPLKERLQKLLCEGSQLLRYRALKHYAPDCSDEVFLEVLQEDAWLVQGLWTPKTKLLKLDGPAVEASRDYVLSLFSKHTTIKDTEVEATGRLIRDKVKNMLTVFSKERPLLHDWKFKEPTDVSFIKSYPEIVEKQDIFWTGKKADLEEHITKGGKSRADNRRNAGGKNPSVTVKPEVPTTLTDKGGSSRNTIPPHVVGQKMPEELRRVLPKAFKKVFQTHKVCSYETICQGLRDLAVSTSNNPKADSGMSVNVAVAVDAHQDELQKVISEVAVDIYGSFVSKSSPDHPEYDSLRGVVIKLLQGSPPGAKLMKADVLAAGLSLLEREITNNEYNKVMHDLCETNSSGWVLRKAR